jgi:AraC-like DNA-binding protein
MQSSDPFVGLAGCRLVRPPHLGEHVEITVASRKFRTFPTVVSGTLGICAKFGPDHVVVADGRRRVFPRGAISVRTPGTVWSSDPAPTGWIAINIGPGLLPGPGLRGEMSFFEPGPEVDLPAAARAMVAAESALEAEELVIGLTHAVVREGAVRCPELGGGAPSNAVARARDFLHAHFRDRPTLDDTATAAGVDKYLLIREFRRVTGTTPHAYLVGVRLQEARRLLARGRTPSEVAFATGFADQAHLTRWFRRVHGVTPASYGRQSRPIAASHAIPFKTDPRGRRELSRN